MDELAVTQIDAYMGRSGFVGFKKNQVSRLQVGLGNGLARSILFR